MKIAQRTIYRVRQMRIAGIHSGRRTEYHFLTCEGNWSADPLDAEFFNGRQAAQDKIQTLVRGNGVISIVAVPV